MPVNKHKHGDMLALACKLVAEAKRRGYGATVLIHDEPQHPEDPCLVASDTTLESRAAVRGLLAEALTQSAMLDGADDDGLGAFIQRDYGAFHKRG